MFYILQAEQQGLRQELMPSTVAGHIPLLIASGTVIKPAGGSASR